MGVACRVINGERIAAKSHPTLVAFALTNLIRFVLALLCLAPLMATAAPLSRSRIATDAQFNEMARTVQAGRYASFPQLMFVIDRRAGKTPKVWFVNSRRFDYHIDFVRKSYLSTQSEATLLEASYSNPDRRFILGSIVRYPKLKRFGIEFWEGDVLDRNILEATIALLAPLFPQPLAFKPNSQPQIELGETIPGLKTLDSNSVYGSRDSLVLNAGRATGRLRILPRLTLTTILRRDEIVILDEVPLQMNPVAGIITTAFSTPLSHVNLLAKSWRVPNGYLRNASRDFARFEGSYVTMDAAGDSVLLRPATEREIAAAKIGANARAVHVARADLNFTGFPSLAEQRAGDIIRTGAKAANLGEVVAKMGSPERAGFWVPPGFSIPFVYYDRFVTANQLDKQINTVLEDVSLRDNALARRAALEKLRAAFAAGTFDPTLLASLVARRDSVIGPGGVFARSSTNSEDLPGFNGAGLYTSVPNVVGNDALAAAVKTVWASVWNETAFDAREAAGIDHRSVMASVLIQKGMNAEASGVMITEDPFDPANTGALFINAKRGLGIRVVEGRKVAEQLIYRPDPESIQILTRSTDDAKLVFDEKGGVRELPVEPGRLVLTDATARRLAYVGRRIERMFGGTPQDIEWLIIGDAIHIVQSRPYLRGR